MHEAKTHLLSEEIDVARRGQVIATLVPARRPIPTFGTMPEIRIGADFDDPLPDDVAAALGT